jgi:hypothetical protein
MLDKMRLGAIDADVLFLAKRMPALFQVARYLARAHHHCRELQDVPPPDIGPGTQAHIQ